MNAFHFAIHVQFRLMMTTLVVLVRLARWQSMSRTDGPDPDLMLDA